MGGVYSLGGAVVAALLLRLLPALLDDWGVSIELLTILFGVGILQVLLTAPGGLVDQVPKDLANLGRRLRRLTGPRRAGGEAPPP
jgi:branched-chain amino acid transport system permease protein